MKKIIQIKYSIGNSKIGKDTIIINISSAKNCQAGKMGLCDLFNTRKCYAMKAEIQYPSVLPFRNSQSEIWEKLNANTIIDNIKLIAKSKRKNKIKYLRLNESGDLKSQNCITKLNIIADGLKEYGIKVYTYTHRKDLDYTNLSDNLTINSSWKDKKINNRFLAYKVDVINRIMRMKKDKSIVKCKMDCTNCKICKYSNNLTVLCPIH